MTRCLLALAMAPLLLVGFSVAQLDEAKVAPKLKTVYEWKSIDFTFPSPASRAAMIHQGLYDPTSPVPIDVGYHDNRVFVSFPRFKPGVPSTLATVSPQGNSRSPRMEPYPDWSWHKPGSCNGLTSVFRFKIDECGRLWALDTGSVDIFTGIRHVCPKQVVVFDLRTDKEALRHRFPQSVIKANTILTTIAVDVRERKGGHRDGDDDRRHDGGDRGQYHHHHHEHNGGSRKCTNAFAYISDTTEYGLIVFDSKNDRSWRITANSFYPEPRYGHFKMQGSEFDLMDGILGLALSPPVGSKPRTFYYHALASSSENHVSTSILQNDTLFPNNTNKAQREFKTYVGKRAGQSAAMAMSSSGIMFYTELVTNTLKCYNIRLRYKGENNPSLVRDNERLQFAAGMKIVVDANGEEELWILTDRLQKVIDGSLKESEVNFRVLTAPVKLLVRGTDCDVNDTPIRFGDDRSDDASDGRVIFKEDEE